MNHYRTLKETSNSAKNNMRKAAMNAEYNNMERQKADMTNFRRKPYSVGKCKEN